MGKQTKFQNLLKFTSFLLQFRAIKRVVLIPGTNLWENDAEHSYQLALLAWFIVEDQKLKLDLSKILSLALVHDLVETYAGDTYLFGKKKYKDSKQIRETEAFGQIKKNFPSIKSVHKLIAEYEKKDSEESKFVYALDKVLPMVNIYLGGGVTWRKKKVNLQMLREAKDSKISLSKDIEKYYKIFIRILEKQPELFYVETKKKERKTGLKTQK